MSMVNSASKSIFGICVIVVSMIILHPVYAKSYTEYTLADFNIPPARSGAAVYNNIGGQYGVWNYAPSDVTQGCTISFSTEEALGEGYAIRLAYDVDSPHPAFNGFWMKLENTDFSQYDTLHLYIKGDTASGFTTQVKVELKDRFSNSPYVIKGITDTWKKYSIPFSRFTKITDWSSMKEMVLVFDDILSQPKTGALFIDFIHITAGEKEEGMTSSFEQAEQRMIQNIKDMYQRGEITESELKEYLETIRTTHAAE